MKIADRIMRFWNIPNEEKKILALGILRSGFYLIKVHLVPLKFYRKSLAATSSSNENSKIHEGSQQEIKKILKCVNRIVRIVPWNCNCLNKALIYKYLFDRNNIKNEIKIYVIKNSKNQIAAHAKLHLNIDEDNLFLPEKNKYFHINFNNTRYIIS
jgi:hypothetical protein